MICAPAGGILRMCDTSSIPYSIRVCMVYKEIIAIVDARATTNVRNALQTLQT